MKYFPYQLLLTTLVVLSAFGNHAWADEPPRVQSSGGTTSSENLVPSDCQKNPCPLDRLKEVAENIFNFLIKVGGAAAVLAVVIAGIRYIVAALGGESGAIQAAKQSLLYAIIGTVVLLTAYVIVRTVFTAFGVSSTGSTIPGLQ